MRGVDKFTLSNEKLPAGHTYIHIYYDIVYLMVLFSVCVVNVWWTNSVTPFVFSLISYFVCAPGMRYTLYHIKSVFISTRHGNLGHIRWIYDVIINAWKMKIRHDEIQARRQSIVMQRESISSGCLYFVTCRLWGQWRRKLQQSGD